MPTHVTLKEHIVEEQLAMAAQAKEARRLKQEAEDALAEAKRQQAPDLPLGKKWHVFAGHRKTRPYTPALVRLMKTFLSAKRFVV